MTPKSFSIFSIPQNLSNIKGFALSVLKIVLVFKTTAIVHSATSPYISDIIPSLDTGNKTWRYKISIDDVIAYLRQRDKSGSMIPVGEASSCTTKRRRSFSQVVAPGQEKEVVKYFARVYADYPDVLSTQDMATMTGLHKKSFMRIIAAGHIKILTSSPRYIIPKVYFWEFIGSHRFIDAWSNSEDFIKVPEGFEKWKQ